MYIISLMLTVNRYIFRKSITHFVFWFKILVAIEVSICWVILEGDTLPWIAAIGAHFIHLFCIIIYSLIDGFPISQKTKLVAGFGIALVYTFHSIQVSLFSVAYIEESTIHLIPDNEQFKFSIASIYASSMRTLCLFLWKQTILLLIKKERCVNLRYSPYIKWVTY